MFLLPKRVRRDVCLNLDSSGGSVCGAEQTVLEVSSSRYIHVGIEGVNDSDDIV